MSQHLPKRLFSSAAVAGRAQFAAQATLHLRDRTLDVPTPPLHALGKGPLHLPTIPGRRPLAGIASVQFDDRRADAQFFAGQSMVVFAIVPGVGQQTIDRKVVAGQTHRRRKLRRVLARSRTDHGCREQVTMRVTDQSEFGPGMSKMGPLAAAPDEVTRRVASLQPRSVDDRLRPRVDQAACRGAVEDGGQEKLEAPFLTG